MLRDRERDIQQRAMGCFGFSVILHACGMALLLIAPQLNLFEPTAGASEALGNGSGATYATVELLGDRADGGDAKPKAQLAAPESAGPNDVAVAAPAPKPEEVKKEEAPVAPPVVAQAPAPAPPVEKPAPKAAPVAAAKLEKKRPAPKPVAVAAMPAKAAHAKTPARDDGDIAAALVASRAHDDDASPAEEQVEAPPVEAKKKSIESETAKAMAATAATQDDVDQDADEAPAAKPVMAVAANDRSSTMKKAALAAEEREEALAEAAEAKAAAAPAPAPAKAAPAPAPVAATAPAQTAGKGAGQGAAPAPGQPSGSPDGKVAGLAAASGAATQGNGKPVGAPTGIRNADDLREAPGNPKPVYPDDDRFAGREGTVVFLALVNPDGSLAQIRLEKGAGSQSLDNSAIAAFRRHKYMPGQQGWVRKAFHFSLSGEAEERPTRLQR